MRNIIITGLALLSILTGCETNSNEESTDQVTASKPSETSSKQEEYIMKTTMENGQVLRVFSAYEYVDQYVNKAEKVKSSDEKRELWQEIVMERVQESCLRGVYSHLVKDYVNNPPEELEEVENDITMLRATEPEKSVLQALKKSADALPGEDTTVCLLPGGNEEYAGVNVGAGRITVFYFPDFQNQLKQTVAHEYHHSTWTKKFSGNYEWDLLGNIIFEGKAVYFSSLLYGQPDLATYSNMDRRQEKRLWNQVKGSLDTTAQKTVNAVLYGDEKEFPYSFGYITGYHIVRKYVENHPQATIKEWTVLPPEQLYEESGYAESL